MSILKMPCNGSVKGSSRAQTLIEHVCSLNIDDPVERNRKTGIICTIGPASRSVDMLISLIEAGMNIVRLNFSHGTHEYHHQTLENLKIALTRVKGGTAPTVAVALDTKGPEIRTGILTGGPTSEIELKKNDKITLTVDEKFKSACTQNLLYVDYKNITKVVAKGSYVYIDDGLIALVVEQVDKESLICRIENGGKLGSLKGVNLPHAKVDLPALSEKDIQDLKFAVDHDMDFIFASFIRTVEDLRSIRKVLGEKGQNIKIIAKIENHEGVQNVNDIIEQADGIMVARGDLGIEIPAEKVFVAQKSIIAKCKIRGKPAICATQMLESMISKPRPTRAECSDVANAVLDGADCVMLSGETAKGAYPLEAVRIMHQVCCQAESVFFHSNFFNEIIQTVQKPTGATSTVGIAVTSAVISMNASGIIVISETGRSAALLSKFRPPCIVIAIVHDPRVARYLQLYHGIQPLLIEMPKVSSFIESVEHRINYAMNHGKQKGYFRSGDSIAIVTGRQKGPGFTNTIRFVPVP
uniref:Pyruvate kinase n=1 Tax=Trichuris muris TaxID=70415 RepID=A0A5S6QQ89_TRIMR